MMRLHDVSLSTALQTCRQLEGEGWIEARPRSGYFVRQPRRTAIMPPDEPDTAVPPDPAQYVGIHARVSDFIAKGRAMPVKVNFSGARAAPEFYPAAQLKNAAIRALRRYPELLVRSAPAGGNLHFRTVLAKRALDNGMVLAPEEVTITHGCIEALNLALRALEIPTSAGSGLSIEALELAMQTYDNISLPWLAMSRGSPLRLGPRAYRLGLAWQVRGKLL